MASNPSETSEPVVCRRVPCRDGRERVWQAIELVRQAPRQQYQPEAKVARTSTRPRTALSGGRPMQQAALYARVSTDKQEREETIESQLDALSHAVAVGAYEVPAGGVFVDEHASGTRLDRPALDRWRDLAAEGAFDTVVVWSPDRRARRDAYQVVLLEELTRCGCEVVFVPSPLRPQSRGTDVMAHPGGLCRV